MAKIFSLVFASALVMGCASTQGGRAPAATPAGGGKVCYYEGDSGNANCSQITTAGVKFHVDHDPKKKDKHAYVSVTQAGMNSCLAYEGFAKKIGVSLYELKHIFLESDIVVACRSNKANGGQMEVTGFYNSSYN